MERRIWMATPAMALVGVLAAGAMLPAVADDGAPEPPSDETWECPLQDGPEDREARMADRETHRAEREALRRERMAAAVEAGELTEEEVEEMLASRGPHRERAGGPRHGRAMRDAGR